MLDFSTIRTVLFDMDGVLYRGDYVLPGVREILAFCDQQSIRYGCITNNASKTRQQYHHKLTAMQIPIPSECVISSALATGHYLREHYPRGTTVYVIGMEGLRDALFHDGYFVAEEDRPQLVVQGVDFELTYETLKRGCMAIRAGARFIATNPDRTFPSEEGLIPGAGALMAALQASTDVQPLIVGKPQPIMFQVALKMLEGNPETTVMIGDRLDTDIIGAHQANLRSILVLTGVTSRADLAASPYQPDAIFEDLVQVLEAWQGLRKSGE